MTDLKARAWLSLAVLALIMGLLLFGCAGTVRYWQAWIYLSLFVGLSAAITLDLMRHDPALLARRMKGGPTAEPRPLQRLIMVGASLGFIGLLVVPALDFDSSRPTSRSAASSSAMRCSCSGSVPLPASIERTRSPRQPFRSPKASASLRRVPTPSSAIRCTRAHCCTDRPSAGARLIPGTARACRNAAVSNLAIAR